jgi:hypothetical protein
MRVEGEQTSPAHVGQPHAGWTLWLGLRRGFWEYRNLGLALIRLGVLGKAWRVVQEPCPLEDLRACALRRAPVSGSDR